MTSTSQPIMLSTRRAPSLHPLTVLRHRFIPAPDRPDYNDRHVSPSTSVHVSSTTNTSAELIQTSLRVEARFKKKITIQENDMRDAVCQSICNFRVSRTILTFAHFDYPCVFPRIWIMNSFKEVVWLVRFVFLFVRLLAGSLKMLWKDLPEIFIKDRSRSWIRFFHLC